MCSSSAAALSATQGVARLIDGMDIDEAISRIEGIQCGFRPTSCPDQLAQALKEYKANVTGIFEEILHVELA